MYYNFQSEVVSMRSVSMREANQKFSACVAAVENGEHLVIKRRGKPAVQMIAAEKVMSPGEREKILKRMRAVLEKGFPLGAQAPTRDEMHDR